MKRRKLSTWLNEEGIRKYGVKIQPFWLAKGSYGYSSYDQTKEQENIEDTKQGFIDLLITFASILSVDANDLFYLLPAGIFVDFFLDDRNKFQFKRYTHGISGIANFLNGYLAYQVIFNKKARLYLPILSTCEQLYSTIKDSDQTDINQFAHWGGYFAGFLFNGILNQLRVMVGGVGFLRRFDVILAVLAFVKFYYS